MTDVTPPAVPGATLLRYDAREGFIFIFCPDPGCQAATMCPAETLAETVRAFGHNDPACPVQAQIDAALRAFAHGEARLT